MEKLYRVTAATAVMVVLLLSLSACNDFERQSWVAIRDADAAIEQAAMEWEAWKEADPPVFTPEALEKIRRGLVAANESLSAAERGFTSYRLTQKLFWEDKATEQDVTAAQRELLQLIGSVGSAIAAVRDAIAALRGEQGQAAVGLYVNQAAVSGALLLLLTNLFGQLSGALIGGKKGLITSAAVNLIAAVMKVHKQATGEDIDLALPALRKRIEERRKRLAA